MTMENTARKLGGPDSARTGIHLVYSRSWTYQQRMQAPFTPAGPAPQRAEEPSRRINTVLTLIAAALAIPGVWALHSIFHSLHLL